jgi:hypothetical protein
MPSRATGLGQWPAQPIPCGLSWAQPKKKQKKKQKVKKIEKIKNMCMRNNKFILFVYSLALELE